MVTRENCIGLKFGKLLILKDIEDILQGKQRVRAVECLCDCGNTTEVRLAKLKQGHVKSCGCFQKEQVSKANTTHGLSTTDIGVKILGTWHTMIARCHNSENQQYCRYGAKGIFVQDSWINSLDKFKSYVLSLDGFDLNKSLDRLDNNKGYEEDNLRWATDAQQQRNRKISSVNTSGVTGVIFFVQASGFTVARAQWVDTFGVSRNKTFSTNKYGLLPAFKMAVEHRRKMIGDMNEQGAGYTNAHGI